MQQLRHRWDAMRKGLGRLDEKRWTIHTLRHTFVTRLVRAGVPLPTVQVLAGHKRIETTMRYVHTTDAEKRAALRGARARMDV